MGCELKIYPENILSDDRTITVDRPADADAPLYRLWDYSLDFLYKSSTSGGLNVTIDTADLPEFDLLYIPIGHNFDGLNVQWQTSPDLTAWTDLLPVELAGNDAIVKTLSTPQSAAWLRLSVSSTVNPQFGELFISKGYTFKVKAAASPTQAYAANVAWRRTVANSRRSTKLGPVKKSWEQSLFLDYAELASFQECMGKTNDFARPFLAWRSKENQYLWVYVSDYVESYDNPKRTRIRLVLSEV